MSVAATGPGYGESHRDGPPPAPLDGVAPPPRPGDGYLIAEVGPVADPLGSGVALLAGEPGPWLLYELPDQVVVGLGVTAEVVLTRHEVVRHGPGGTVTREPLGERPLDQLRRLVAGCGVAGWRAHGWCAFELSHLLHGRPEAAGEETLAHVVVPAREVRLGVDRCAVRARDEADLARLRARLHPLADQRSVPVPGAEAAPVDPDLVDEEAGAEGYRGAVREAVEEIRAGAPRKVVLSREVPVPGGVDLLATYRAGRDGNTPARSFVLDLGGMRAAGFSPETVVEVSADGAVSTQPLAGTRALHGDRARDAELGRELLADPKEVFEHAISVHAAQQELRTVCRPGSVTVGEFMSLTRRGSVQHLASRVNGRLAEGQDGWRALAGLFPAATVSGLPKREAVAAISGHEGSPRRLYGGVVLTATAEGELDAALVLRTVFESGGRTWVRVGAGIVEHSTPERELEETREKLRSVSRFLVPRRRGKAGWLRRERR